MAAALGRGIWKCRVGVACRGERGFYSTAGGGRDRVLDHSRIPFQEGEKGGMDACHERGQWDSDPRCGMGGPEDTVPRSRPDTNGQIP